MYQRQKSIFVVTAFASCLAGCSFFSPQEGDVGALSTADRLYENFNRGMAILGSRTERMRDSIPTEGTKYCSLKEASTMAVAEVKLPENVGNPPISERYGVKVVAHIPLGSMVVCSCDQIEQVGANSFTCHHTRRNASDYDYDTVLAVCKDPWRLVTTQSNDKLKLECLP